MPRNPAFDEFSPSEKILAGIGRYMYAVPGVPALSQLAGYGKMSTSGSEKAEYDRATEGAGMEDVGELVPDIVLGALSGSAILKQFPNLAKTASPLLRTIKQNVVGSMPIAGLHSLQNDASSGANDLYMSALIPFAGKAASKIPIKDLGKKITAFHATPTKFNKFAPRTTWFTGSEDFAKEFTQMKYGRDAAKNAHVVKVEVDPKDIASEEQLVETMNEVWPERPVKIGDNLFDRLDPNLGKYTLTEINFYLDALRKKGFKGAYMQDYNPFNIDKGERYQSLALFDPQKDAKIIGKETFGKVEPKPKKRILYHSTPNEFTEFDENPGWFSTNKTDAKGWHQTIADIYDGKSPQSNATRTLKVEVDPEDIATQEQALEILREIHPSYQRADYTLVDEFQPDYTKKHSEAFLAKLKERGFKGAELLTDDPRNPEMGDLIKSVYLLEPKKHAKIVDKMPFSNSASKQRQLEKEYATQSYNELIERMESKGLNESKGQVQKPYMDRVNTLSDDHLETLGLLVHDKAHTLEYGKKHPAMQKAFRLFGEPINVPLYRGFKNLEDIEKMKTGQPLDNYSSWSYDPEIAKRFGKVVTLTRAKNAFDYEKYLVHTNEDMKLKDPESFSANDGNYMIESAHEEKEVILPFKSKFKLLDENSLTFEQQ